MTTAAGVAAVTAVLKDLLLNGLIDHDAASVVGDVVVTAQAPDRIELPEKRSQLNLFLYLLTPNQGWRNVDQPSRDARGDLVTAPLLGLDLHYLLTAYGAADFHAEILLGYGMQLLHEMPVLTRAAIRAALAPSQIVPGGSLPGDLRDLFLSGLADQIEQIKVCQTFLSTEEMFKLWMAFQSPYRPTAAYHVSVVLMESERRGKSSLPVRQHVVEAVTFRQPEIGRLESRSGPTGTFSPDRAIETGDEVALVGTRLAGDVVKVVVAGLEIAPNAVADAQVTFTLPAGVPAGVNSVFVSHQVLIGAPPTPHPGTSSSPVPLVLRPSVVSLAVSIAAGSGASDTTPRTGSLTVTVSPEVGQEQLVSVLLNEFQPPSPTVRPPRAYRFDAPPRTQANAPATSPTVTFPIAGILPATYVVRVRIDGAESVLGVSPQGVYNSPQLVIP